MNNEQGIPNYVKQPIDLQEMVKDKPGPAVSPKPIPLADAVRMLRLDACVVCSRGGHTRHTLYTVYKDGTAREKVKACADHVTQFVRPKDVGRK